MVKRQSPTKVNFLSFFEKLDPLSKLVFLSLGFASLGLLVIIIWNTFIRFTAPQITIAAGDQEGESYILSEAIQKIIEQKSNIDIELLTTGGTTQNLQMLQEGKAQLATVQADVVGQEMDVTKSRKSQIANFQDKVSPQAVAVLYQDLFQLVIRDSNIKQFEQLRGKTIALPAKGGQY